MLLQMLDAICYECRDVQYSVLVALQHCSSELMIAQALSLTVVCLCMCCQSCICYY